MKTYLFNYFIISILANQTAHSKSQTMSKESLILGFGLILFNGLLATLGAFILYSDVITAKLFKVTTFKLSESKTFLSGAISFTCGILLVTIFLNLYVEGISSLKDSKLLPKNHGGTIGAIYYCFMLATCMTFKNSVFKDNKTKHKNHPNFTEIKSFHDNDELKFKFKKIGMNIAFALTLHNLPEGIITVIAAHHSLKLGLTLGVTTGLHKIPRGMMVAVPMYFSTSSKKKVVLTTAVVDFVPQLIGGLIGYILVTYYWSVLINGLLFLTAASILTHTLFNEMIPLTKLYDPQDKYSTSSLCCGVIFNIITTSMLETYLL